MRAAKWAPLDTKHLHFGLSALMSDDERRVEPSEGLLNIIIEACASMRPEHSICAKGSPQVRATQYSRLVNLIWIHCEDWQLGSFSTCLRSPAQWLGNSRFFKALQLRPPNSLEDKASCNLDYHIGLK
ncbi:hypothetical protein PM082_013305 [Marasmius tenuissimus]|nr:hypothetical protein PM082_013305 [Marasmius tenuissimus]